MSKTLFCIRLSRTLIILLILIFITLTLMQIFHIKLIPWPTYNPIVAILLDICLAIGLIATLTQHLKTLIFFSWLSALTFMLIFFGNTVSSQYQSDLIGMFYLLLICFLSFTDAVCIIKYRMPSEEAHHPFVKCNQAPPLPLPFPHHHHPTSLFDQHHTMAAATTNAASVAAMVAATSASDSASLIALSPHYILHHHSPHAPPPPPPPPPPPHSQPPPLSSSQPQSSSSSSYPSGGGGGGVGANATSPSTPLPPSLNSHNCYVSKNDPQFHAV